MIERNPAIALDPRTLLIAMLRHQPDLIDWPSVRDEEWSQLVETAQAEGVTALIWQYGATHGWPAALPSRVRGALQLAYYQTTAQTLLLRDELIHVLAALGDEHDVVILKGAALGSTVYDQPNQRPLSDLDLLVPQAQLPAITGKLVALGYEAVPELTPGLNAVVEYHTRFTGGPGQRVAVEVHWRLVAGEADWRSPATDWFWQQTEPWHTDQIAALHLTPAAHLLYLAAHLVLQHGGAQPRLIWLYDLHLLLTRCADQIAWQALTTQARACRWSAALHTALVATQQTFGTPVPADVLASLSLDIDNRSHALIEQKAHAAPSPLIHEWIKLRALDRRARLRFARSLIVPEPSYIGWRYPHLRPWLGYAYHWLRLALAGAQLGVQATDQIMRRPKHKR